MFIPFFPKLEYIGLTIDSKSGIPKNLPNLKEISRGRACTSRLEEIMDDYPYVKIWGKNRFEHYMSKIHEKMNRIIKEKYFEEKQRKKDKIIQSYIQKNFKGVKSCIQVCFENHKDEFCICYMCKTKNTLVV